ncbi:MAG: A/G-specific adenine glycosylase [Amoebophilaceae bacterium]|jgi:A/G-specific adenine glycosylase|nr:A/G-specific adenine glycosylase [Amoebophilaceae bacterium]
MLEKTLFASWLVTWYQAYKRNLPWRETNDPYKIWLSEVILQQTRVAQGLPYYQRFVARYPSIQALACADEEEVLRLWQGLGYYSRARNLHACARVVVNELGGKFPSTYKDLLHLKGIGQYTAGAIASIAFKESVPVVDGNVYRVLSRVFGEEEDIASTRGIKVFYALARSLVPIKDPDLYNQAIMEFGAMHCTPNNPKCESCIFKAHCVAFRTGRQYALPVKSKKIKIKQRFFHYLVIQHADKLYMKCRKDRDIWQGLYDFYLIENRRLSGLDRLDDTLAALIQHHKLPVSNKPTLHKYLLTHRQLYVHFLRVQATASFIREATPLLSQTGIRSFTIAQTRALPKPILIDNFLKEEFYS